MMISEFSDDATSQAGAAPLTIETPHGPVNLVTVARGHVDPSAFQYARMRLGPVFADIAEPILLAYLKLAEAADPARSRPAMAQVLVDINGDLLRAHVTARDMPEAIDLMQQRLRDKLQHRADRKKAARRRGGVIGELGSSGSFGQQEV